MEQRSGFPVWVGSLKKTIKESDLVTLFSQLGTVVSCRVIQDPSGISKGFGYVNFISSEEAERAARDLNGCCLHGSPMKVKGPNMLKEEGHLDSAGKQPVTLQNYRPYTDCSFFMQGAKCKKGTTCPYRHSELALVSPHTCPEWLEKKCLNIDCPYKHPGGKESVKDQAIFVQASAKATLRKCGGRCGELKCAALFESDEDLEQHIRANRMPDRMPQCRFCRAIFPSEVEYRQHLSTCWARSNLASAGRCSSESSADVEVISDDDDNSDSLNEEEDPIVIGRSRGSSSSDLLGGGRPMSSPQRAGDGSTPSPVKAKKRTRRRRRKGSQKGLVGPASGGGVGSTGVPTTLGVDRYGIPYSGNSDNLYGAYDNTDSDDVDDDDDDEEEEEEEEEESQRAPGEMTRLLSLNEQDMMEETEGSGAMYNSAVATPPRPSLPPDNKITSPSQRVRLEPVGVFWDIENCPVPIDKSAFGVAAKMRKEFIGGKREAEFMCVCDITKERKEVTDDLHKAQVTLVHVNAIAKNAADDKLRQSLRRFAHTYPAPSTVVLISGDVNFSMELNDLIHLHNITVVLVHNPQASQALKVFATRLVDYEDFITDVEPPLNQQDPNLSRIVIVSGLPRHVAPGKIAARLDRISDNCGGKVLRVDTNTGTARILFRTNEWAKKALKRMKGEDVHGYRVNTDLEAPSQPPPKSQQAANSRLIGHNLSSSFPPRNGPSATRPPPPSSVTPANYPLLPPPPPHQHHPIPANTRPHFMQHYPNRMPFTPPTATMPLPPPVNQYPHQQQQLLGGPVLSPRHPLIMPTTSHPPPFPPPPPRQQYPHFALPPSSKPAPHLPKGPLPRPDGKILIFKIPPAYEQHVDQSVHFLQSSCQMSAEFLVLWHSYSELQVLLKLDFVQTAILRKEDIIKTLYEKGELKSESASKFVDNCTKSVSDVMRRHRVLWDVTTCGWSSDEEDNRIIRSNVVRLLRLNPTAWTKFSNFKKRYLEKYSSALSEMTIHNACRGAVQLLSNQDSVGTQVIIFYDFSPLVKIPNHPGLHSRLKNDFTRLLSLSPEKKIRLLDFVSAFHQAKLGTLPTDPNGKMLQEVITSTPNVVLIGTKPSNIYVTLTSGKNGSKNSAGPRAAAPTNLAGISASFCHLIEARGTNGALPYKKFQQEYQTFYHHSFRVSDYLPGSTAGVAELINACQGVKIVRVLQPSGKKEDMVCLEAAVPSLAGEKTSTTTAPPPVTGTNNSSIKTSIITTTTSSVGAVPAAKPSTANVPAPPIPKPPESASAIASSSRTSSTATVPPLPTTASPPRLSPPVNGPSTSGTPSGKSSAAEVNSFVPRDLASLSAAFSMLLEDRGNNGSIPLKIFQQEYQTYFHHSFKVSDYLIGDYRVRDLVQFCQGVKLANVAVPPNGKVVEMVCLDKTAQLEKSTKSAPPTLEDIAANFRTLLEHSDNKQLPFRITQQAYQTFFHGSFRVSKYLPEGFGLRDLLEACKGIKIVNMETNEGWQDMVCLESTAGKATTAPVAKGIQKVTSSSELSSAATTTSPATPLSKISSATRSSSPPASPAKREHSSPSTSGSPSGKSAAEVNSFVPRDLASLSAAFCMLLQDRGNNGCIPLRTFQQEYQTYFHHSFKVSDYLIGDYRVRDLVQFCQGVKLANVAVPPNGKVVEMVCLDKTAQLEKSTKSAPPTLENIAANFRTLLEHSDNKQLPLRITQQAYQTFFHGSFRVSKYLPEGSGLRDLLEACKGIKIICMETSEGWQDVVCLESSTGKAVTAPVAKVATAPVAKEVQKVASSSELSTGSAPPHQLSPDAVLAFKKDCVEVLSSVEGHAVLVSKFPAYYSKLKKEPFSLSKYQARKIIHLAEAITDVIEISCTKDAKVLRLIDPKRTCEREVEALVYSQPNRCITLDHFMAAYEKKYGHRLEHFFGHPKLLKLLEDFPDTLKISGSGPARVVSIVPLRLLARQLAELLSVHTSMPISKIVPAYKEKFGRDLVITNFGFPKLIKALEALPELIEIRGVGAARVASLNPTHYLLFPTSSSSSLAPSATLPPPPPSPLSKPHPYMDEVTAVLLSTHNQKLSLIELTKGFNQAFRANSASKVDSNELLQAINKLPNFKVTGTGPLMYVQLVNSPVSKIPPPSQVIPTTSHVPTPSQPPITSQPPTPSQPPTTSQPPTPSQPPTNSLSPQKTLPSEPHRQDTSELAASGGSVARKRLFSSSSEVPDSFSGTGSGVRTRELSSSSEDDTTPDERLISEIRRMLLSHQEHAMTLAELVESFLANQDPTHPTAESLYRQLSTHNLTQKFEISHFPSDVGASLIQLNRNDCLWKLGEDLLHLFVFHPTPDLSLPVSKLEELYEQCYSRKLITAVYAAKDINQLLRAKALKKCIQVDNAAVVTPSDAYKQQVLAELLVELLFVRGEECRALEDLSELYREYYKSPLPLDCFGKENLPQLMQLSKVFDAISLIHVNVAGTKKLKPVLKPTTLFLEQLRCLLTKYNGQIALDQLEQLYIAEFGVPSDLEMAKHIRKKKLPFFSFKVGNLASRKWVLWSPFAYPYPLHRRQSARNQLAPASGATSSGSDMSAASSCLTPVAYADSGCYVQGSFSQVEVAQDEPRVEQKKPAELNEGSPDLISFDEGPPALERIQSVSPPPVVDLIDFSSDMNNLTRVDGHSSEATPPQQSSSDIADFSLEPFDLHFTKSDTTAESTAKLDDGGSATVAAGAVVFDSPYDFLKNEPEILAGLSHIKSSDFEDCTLPDEDLRVLAEVLTIQRLKELAEAANTAADLMNDDKGTSKKAEVLVSLLPTGSSSTTRVECDNSGGSASSGNGGNGRLVDYFKHGLNPDQVLDELQKLKESSGGVLSPDQMEPFLDYFGELSSRELERIESLQKQEEEEEGEEEEGNEEEGEEEKLKEKGRGTPGRTRKKRIMAIRFPGDSSPPSHNLSSSLHPPPPNFSSSSVTAVVSAAAALAPPTADSATLNSGENSSRKHCPPLEMNDNMVPLSGLLPPSSSHCDACSYSSASAIAPQDGGDDSGIITATTRLAGLNVGDDDDMSRLYLSACNHLES